MKNDEIAALLLEMGDLLELSGETGFKPVAYRRAARTLESLHEDIAGVAREGRLGELPGIGDAIRKKIEEALERGTFRQLDELRAQVPPGLLDFLRVPGLGPKTAALIHQRLGITTLAELERAAREGRLRGLPGMGEKREANILAGLAGREARTRRALLAEAWPDAEEIRQGLAECEAVIEVAIAGSLRRRRETIGDIDLVASSERPEEVMERFARLPQVAEVIARGPTKTSVLTHAGRQVDLRVVAPHQYGAALHHFTGSKEHNVAMRGRAKERGLRINEYGVFLVPEDGEFDVEGAEDLADAGVHHRAGRRPTGEPLPVRTEADVFAAVGLPFIPPELRENQGEIEAAEAGALPKLIEPRDIRGDLHLHSRWSDGTASIGEMARAARAFGYEYIVIADHSRSLVIASGLDADALRRQREEIERVNEQLRAEAAAGDVPPFTVFAGIEVDILKDGRLDLPDEVLAELDFVTASIHSSFRPDAAEMTRRLEAALRNPHVDSIGHLTGRLLGRRDGYPVDFERIVELAVETGTALEINGSPERLDVCAAWARQARDAGVRLVISSDAHSTAGLQAMWFGVTQARRGWIEAKDVINARPLAEFRRYLEKRRA